MAERVEAAHAEADRHPAPARRGASQRAERADQQPVERRVPIALARSAAPRTRRSRPPAPARSRSSRSRSNGSRRCRSGRCGPARCARYRRRRARRACKSSSAPPNRERIRRAAFATPRILPKSREKKRHDPIALAERKADPITTAADLPERHAGRQPEAELAQRPLVLPPVAAAPARSSSRKTLIPKNASSSRRAAVPIRLSMRPALADEDPLLRVLLDEDGGPDVQACRAPPFRQLLDPDRHRVGHLLVREVKDLLADHLGHVERLGLVAGRVRRGRTADARAARRTISSSSRSQLVPSSGGDRDDLRERVPDAASAR